MRKYYIHNGTEQLGPFDLNELKDLNIHKETFIWYDGLKDWTSADKIEDFSDLLKTANPPTFNANKSMPPPINFNQNYPIIFKILCSVERPGVKIAMYFGAKYIN